MSSPVKLQAPFALAQDTADILGVSNARLAALRKILTESAKPVVRSRVSPACKRRPLQAVSTSVRATANRSAKKAKKNS